MICSKRYMVVQQTLKPTDLKVPAMQAKYSFFVR